MRRWVRNFLHNSPEGLLDYDIHLPRITTAKRDRHCRGVIQNGDKWERCDRIIGKGNKTLTVRGYTGFGYNNPHHYCPDCAKKLLETIKGHTDNVVKDLDEILMSKKELKDKELSERKKIWREVFVQPNERE